MRLKVLFQPVFSGQFLAANVALKIVPRVERFAVQFEKTCKELIHCFKKVTKLLLYGHKIHNKKNLQMQSFVVEFYIYSNSQRMLFFLIDKQLLRKKLSTNSKIIYIQMDIIKVIILKR